MTLPPYETVTVDIATYVYHYDLSPQTHSKAFQYARVALLDALGCAVETVHKSAQARAMLGPIVSGTVTPNGFKLPGTSYQLDPVKGAFDLATAIRFLDHNDAIAGADWGHPSDNLGAILAVADWLSRSNGAHPRRGPPLTINAILEALIKAYEIQGCFLLRNAFHVHGLDHVILVKLASTAVVSWLLGLSEHQCQAALSHVWMDGHALRTYRSGTNTIPRKGWAAGDACMKAVHLALLARAGQPGAPTALTMPRWGFYAASFGGQAFELPKRYGTWVVEHVFFKTMPVEGHGVAAAEAALRHHAVLALRKLQPAASHIARIQIRTNAAADLIINKPTGPLSNAADRDHCMQYIVALAFLKGDVPAAEDFLDSSPWATSTELQALRARIEIRVDEALTRDYLDLDKKSLAAGMTVHLTDGSVLSEVLVEFPVGHVQSPKTLASVEMKYKRNMGLMFSHEEMQAIRALVEERPDASVSELTDLLARDGAVMGKL